MRSINLPVTRADAPVAFSDTASAEQWLAGLPRANLGPMLTALQREIVAFNGLALPARERFRTLEILRRVAFDTCDEARKRYEAKPLPLSEAAAAMLNGVRDMWRALATGYLHCLGASVGGEAGFAAYGARAAHRVLFCLRQEQWHGDLARYQPSVGFWGLAHTVFSCAESLAVVREEVEDRLLPEMRMSSVAGQYAMLHLLDLASPATLSRTQYVAATRWFSRWREQVSLDETATVRAFPVNLQNDEARGDAPGAAVGWRWLNLDNVVRKLRRRRAALAEGATPESLKLGDALSGAACEQLLGQLEERMRSPGTERAQSEGCALAVGVVAGVESIFYLLGGTGLLDDVQSTTTSFVSRLRHERIAVFGHAGENEPQIEVKREPWQLCGQDGQELRLLRPVGAGESRLMLRSLLAVCSAQSERIGLAEISSLSVLPDGRMQVAARLISGRVQPVLAAVRDKATGRQTRQPAFGLAGASAAPPAWVVLPAGLRSRAASLSLLDLSGATLPYGLADLAGRGDDFELWGVADS